MPEGPSEVLIIADTNCVPEFVAADLLSQAEQQMSKAIQHLEVELVKIRAGRANPNMVDGIVVDYYGSPTPIQQVGNISVTDARTL
jgi:ribosome recycling factor